jgi:hypothetical protein
MNPPVIGVTGLTPGSEFKAIHKRHMDYSMTLHPPEIKLAKADLF